MHTLLEGVTGALIDGLHTLDIDRGENEVVLWEHVTFVDSAVFVETEDGRTDHLGRVLVEVIEGDTGNSTADLRSDRLAEITDEIRDGEEFGDFFRVGGIDDLQGKCLSNRDRRRSLTSKCQL